MAILAPTTARAVENWLPLHRWLPLAGDELRLAAEYFLALTAYSVRSLRRRRLYVSSQSVASALVMLASAAMYAAADVNPVGEDLTVKAGGRAALTAYNGLFTVHSSWCVCLFTLVIHRSARHVGPGLLRVGLRLVVAGGATGLIWTILSLLPLVDGLTLGHQKSAEDWYSAPAALLTIALGIGGATLTAWGEQVTRRVRWLRAWRHYRRLGPLWSALYAARPEIALTAPTGRLAAGLPPRDAEFALYRRVIEIRDGHLSLRAHFHPQVPNWAAEACADAGDDSPDVSPDDGPPDDGAPDDGRFAATADTGVGTAVDTPADTAVVEAAVIAAALEAAAVGRQYRGDDGGYAPHEVRADLEAETAWLILVSEAFTDSAVVAAVRRRIRVELGLHG